MRTTTQPSLGRIVHVYSPKWEGPRAALISAVLMAAADTASICAFVALNPDMDGGQSFDHAHDIPLSDPATPEQRAGFEAKTWAEWPPHVSPAARPHPQGKLATPAEVSAKGLPLNVTISVDQIARNSHEGQKRWDDLDTNARKQASRKVNRIAREVALAVEMQTGNTVRVSVTDEYGSGSQTSPAQPSPSSSGSASTTSSSTNSGSSATAPTSPGRDAGLDPTGAKPIGT